MYNLVPQGTTSSRWTRMWPVSRATTRGTPRVAKISKGMSLGQEWKYGYVARVSLSVSLVNFVTWCRRRQHPPNFIHAAPLTHLSFRTSLPYHTRSWFKTGTASLSFLPCGPSRTSNTELPHDTEARDGGAEMQACTAWELNKPTLFSLICANLYTTISNPLVLSCIATIVKLYIH
jgi:hypothetical protein